MFQIQLNQKADATYVERTLEKKANTSSVERDMSELRETLQRHQRRLEAYEHQLAQMTASRTSFLKEREKIIELRKESVPENKREASSGDKSRKSKKLKSKKGQEVSIRYCSGLQCCRH